MLKMTCNPTSPTAYESRPKRRALRSHTANEQRPEDYSIRSCFCICRSGRSWDERCKRSIEVFGGAGHPPPSTQRQPFLVCLPIICFLALQHSGDESVRHLSMVDSPGVQHLSLNRLQFHLESTGLTVLGGTVKQYPTIVHPHAALSGRLVP